MTAAHFEDHPTDPKKVVIRKPKQEFKCPICQDKPREWVGLTDKEKLDIYQQQKFVLGFYKPSTFADAIEQLLREKNS